MEVTLTGFSSFLDWRPLTFLKPVPRAWTCDICGLMSRALTVTECLHVFCSNCYQHLLDKEDPKCPLDKVVVSADETKKFVLGDNQRKLFLVRCMNAEHGCKFEGPFEDLEAHYTKDCNFHVVTCKRCGSTSFHTQLLEHLEKNCRAQLEDVAPGLTQKLVPGECPNPGTDHGGKSSEELSGVTKSSALVETMKQYLEDLEKDLTEALQHCKAAKDSKSMTSSLVDPVLQNAQHVEGIQKYTKKLTPMIRALVELTKPVDTNLGGSCEKIPTYWLALGALSSGVREEKYVFTCTNFAAKVAGAPAGVEPSDVYPARCPKGRVLIKGREVQICQLVYEDSTRHAIGFRLTFLGQSQNCGSGIDMTLVLVHPTDASLNKCRPLKCDEIFKNQSEVEDFAFFADDLCKDGFVADDMLVVCLEVAE
ncbi:unnamed protein product [Ixodes pacificus]